MPCMYCKQVLTRQAWDTHVYKECPEYVITCRVCKKRYARKEEAHRCEGAGIEVKEEGPGVVAKTQMERDGWQERARKERERRERAEEEVRRLKKENEELSRRVEQMGLGAPTAPGGEENQTVGVGEGDVDIDQITYSERFSYSLEHYGKISALILLDPKYLGFTSSTPG